MIVSFLALPTGCSSGAAVDHGETGDPHWVTTWASALADGGSLAELVYAFDDVTVRQTVHTSVGGTAVRVRFSNYFGTTPIFLGAARVALRGTGASIVQASDRALTFANLPSVRLMPGQIVASDPLAFDVSQLTDLVVSIDLPEPATGVTSHAGAPQTFYWSHPAGGAESADLGGATETPGLVFLAGVDVTPAVPALGIAALGGSITEGFASSTNANHRWPDDLAQRLFAATMPAGIANEGYGGNQLLVDGQGPSGVSRFGRDVLGNAGLTHAIVTEGTNDIGISAASSDALIEGLRQVIDQGRAAGLKVIGGTLPPFEGASYFSTGGETTRAAVNDWIRTGSAFDGVIDFDAALRDPNAPTRLLPAYDSGDALHPNDAGYEAMALAIDLSLFE